MKKLIWLFAFAGIAFCSNAQRLKKYTIGNSGCSVYLFCNTEFSESYSEDSSKIYTGECEADSLHYGVICVKFSSSVKAKDLNSAQELVITYLDFLKEQFHIKKSAGYGKGNLLNNDENTRGVVDYCEDEEKNKWKIKGWTNGKFIGIVYVYAAKELPDTKITVALDSFRFPN